MKKLFKTASMWICGLTVFVNCSYVTASNYPSEPLTMIVPYAAGGSADAFARPIADQLSKIRRASA